MSVRRIFHSHWLSFLFLLPFVVLFALHNALGLSNALMVRADDYPGRAKAFGLDVQLYNLIMGFAFICGAFAYWMHTAYLSGSSRDKNRIFVFVTKTLFLVVYYAWFLFLMNYSGAK